MSRIRVVPRAWRAAIATKSKAAKKPAKKAAAKKAAKKPAKKAPRKPARKAAAKPAKKAAKKPSKKAAKKPAKKAAGKPAKKAAKNQTGKAAAKPTKLAAKKSAKKAAAKPTKKVAARPTKKAAAKPARKAAKKPAGKSTKRAGKKAPKKPITPTTTKKSARSTEVTELARELAAIALMKESQRGRLSIRQREQLRRALISAAVHMGWGAMVASAKNPVEKAVKDLSNLTKRGARAIAGDMADEFKVKKAEMSTLEKSAKAFLKLADEEDFDEPIHVTYVHTSRNGSDGYSTKIETVELLSADDARSTAETIEKKMDTWNKYREAMLEDLKAQRRMLEETKKGISDYVDACRGLLREVFATLH